MKKRSIWIISQNSYAPYMNAGTRHYGMGREWVKEGIQTTIFTSSFNHKTLSETRRFRFFQLYQKELIDGVEFVWIRSLPYRSNDGFDRVLGMMLYSFSVALITLVFRGFRRPGVILGSSPTLIPAFAASIIAWLKRVPFVFEIRDLWPKTIVEFRPEMKRHPLIRVFYKMECFCLRRARYIAGLLPGITKYLVGINPEYSKRFFWLPNGVEVDQVHKAVTARESCKKVVYTGALSRANAMESLVETASICTELEFHFYGGGVDRNSLEEKCRVLSLQNVWFHDPVPKSEVFKVLEDADILIATLKDTDLYKYGISLNKIYDYLAVGKPIVFGARSFNDPVTEAGAGITVEPENPEALASALKKIMSMGIVERKKMGENGKDYMLNNHTFTILAKRLTDKLGYDKPDA